MKQVYVLFWEKRDGAWDIWGVYSELVRASVAQDKLADKFPEKRFYIMTETLDGADGL